MTVSKTGSDMEARDELPDVIRIETTGLCNFKCLHCPTGRQPNRRKALDLESFSVILSQFVASGKIPRVVVLYHGGEPLLNRHLAAFIRKLKEIGVSKTVITTNASLLNEQTAEALVSAGLDEIKVSFDGDSPEDNDRIRKNGNFGRDAANVLVLCRVRKKLRRSNPNIIISNVRICTRKELEVMRGNNSFVFNAPPEYIVSYFKEYLEELSFNSIPAMVWPGYENSGAAIESVVFPECKPTYCAPLFETMTIMSSGDVVPCCYDIRGETVLGNVFQNSLGEIWHGARHTAFRADFMGNKYSSLCLKCAHVVPRYLCKDSDGLGTEK